jgi:hypothetical protein
MKKIQEHVIADLIRNPLQRPIRTWIPGQARDDRPGPARLWRKR